MKECVTLSSASCPCLAYWMRVKHQKNSNKCVLESRWRTAVSHVIKKKKNAEAKFTFIQKRHFWSRAPQGAYSVCRGPSALRCLSGKSLPLMWLEDRGLFPLRLWRAQFICNGSNQHRAARGGAGDEGSADEKRRKSEGGTNFQLLPPRNSLRADRAARSPLRREEETSPHGGPEWKLDSVSPTCHRRRGLQRFRCAPLHPRVSTAPQTPQHWLISDN